MNNKLVEEMDDILHDLDHGNITRGDAKAKLLLAMNAEVEEPLAVLADRKGFGRIQYDAYTDGQKSIYITECETEDKELITEKEFYAPTYALAEAAARAYLEALPDKEAK